MASGRVRVSLRLLSATGNVVAQQRRLIFRRHIIPQSLDPERLLLREYSNLLYACNRCNAIRQDLVLIDPGQDGLGEHLHVNPDGNICGLTTFGVILIDVLHLNHALVVRERQRILRILLRRARYPHDPEVLTDYREAFGYPDDLPDLRRQPPHGPNPPGGNALPENAEHCCFARRERGQLPTILSHGDTPRLYGETDFPT